jgi:hypothetical protein
MKLRYGIYKTRWLTFGLSAKVFLLAGGRSSGVFLTLIWWTLWFDVDTGKKDIPYKGSGKPRQT